MNFATANLLCTVSDQIGEPLGTSINPTSNPAGMGPTCPKWPSTVCSQAPAERRLLPVDDRFDNKHLYVEQPSAPSLIATVDPLTNLKVDGTNDTLIYEVRFTRTNVPETITIPHRTYADPNDPATSIQSTIGQSYPGLPPISNTRRQCAGRRSYPSDLGPRPLRSGCGAE